MNRVHNFSAGPAALPDEVLARAQAELLDWQGRGVSVMEISHRSKEYIAVAEQAEADLRELLEVPNNYRVLFLQGGATQQFAQVPLNLLADGGQADYIDSGIWSRKAIAEAERYGAVHIAASAKSYDYFAIPGQNDWQLSKNAAYLHYCSNETIGGLQFDWIPETGEVPLVADIYAGAQKNIGPAGLALVIIREDLLGHARHACPAALNYQIAANNGSMYNTPPTFSWYLAGLVFDWLKQQGGLSAMQSRNRAKKELLYQAIDQSDFYHNAVGSNVRSWMNVPFRLADERLDKAFLAGAEQRGLMGLKGHRAVGGMRASLYNAVSLKAVQALVDWMCEFEKEQA